MIKYILILFLIFPSLTFADPKILPSGNIELLQDDFLALTDEIESLKIQLKLLEDSKSNFKKQINFYKENEKISEQEIRYYKKIKSAQDELNVYREKRIKDYREEVQKLESKGGSFFDKIRQQAFIPLLLTVILSIL